MRKQRTKRLVVDTDVLVNAAAKPESAHPAAKPCRDALGAILKACHRVVLSAPLSDEWKRHEGRFVLRWRSAMAAKKKPVHALPVAPDEGLRAEALATATKPKEKRALEKDMPLVEAALEADSIALSCDGEAHRLFGQASRSIGKLRNITWVNPVTLGAEGVVEWLMRGATAHKSLRLGHQSE